MKKILVCLLCAVMFGVSVQPALANDETYESGYNPTKEELASKEQKNQEALAYQKNKLKNKYIVQKNILEFGSYFVKQNNDYDCGPASGLMIARFVSENKTNATIVTMRKQMGTVASASGGTSVPGVVKGLNYFVGGYESYSIYDGHSVSGLTEISIDHDKPVMYNVKYMDLPWVNSDDDTINHWIVGYGYHWDPNKNISDFYVADPLWASFRTQTITYRDLEYAMSNVISFSSGKKTYGFFVARG